MSRRIEPWSLGRELLPAYEYHRRFIRISHFAAERARGDIERYAPTVRLANPAFPRLPPGCALGPDPSGNRSNDASVSISITIFAVCLACVDHTRIFASKSIQILVGNFGDSCNRESIGGLPHYATLPI